MPALMKAVICHHLDCASVLLTAGAGCLAKNEVTYTALTIAISLNNQPMVELLLKWGAPLEVGQVCEGGRGTGSG